MTSARRQPQDGRSRRRSCRSPEEASPEDARLLSDAFAPLVERDLFNLPRFRMAIRTSARPLPSGAAATSATVTPRAKCAMDEPVAVRDAVANAVRNNRDDSRVTRSATRKRAQRGPTRKRDTLRYLRAGAIWTALPVRDQRLLLWLLQADVVTAHPTKPSPSVWTHSAAVCLHSACDIPPAKFEAACHQSLQAATEAF